MMYCRITYFHRPKQRAACLLEANKRADKKRGWHIVQIACGKEGAGATCLSHTYSPVRRHIFDAFLLHNRGCEISEYFRWELLDAIEDFICMVLKKYQFMIHEILIYINYITYI